MNRTLAAALLLGATLLGGCSAAGDVASDAASAATSQAKESALTELKGTVCPLVADKELSAADRETVSAAINLAQGLGVESELLAAAEDIIASDGTPPESAIAELTQACR